MDEQNQNAPRVGSQDEDPSGDLVPTAEGLLDWSLCEFDAATETYSRRRPIAPDDPPLPADLSTGSSADLSAGLSAVASAEAEASAKAESSAKADPAAEIAVKAEDSPGTVESAELAKAAPEDDMAEPDWRDRLLEPDPLPIRNRVDGWTPARQRRFLVELADCGVVQEAAARVGMTPKSAWNLRRRAEQTPFADAWEAALKAGMRRLHSIALQRAVEGVVKPYYYRGEKVGEQRVYDNHLLLSLLGKAGEPFDETRASIAESRFEDYLDAVEHEYGRALPRLDLAGNDIAWKDERGVWWTTLPTNDMDNDIVRKGEYEDRNYRRTLSLSEIGAVMNLEVDQFFQGLRERERVFGPEE